MLPVVELVQNHCLDQKTCGECLAAGPPCGWCKQEVNITSIILNWQHVVFAGLEKNLGF